VWSDFNTVTEDSLRIPSKALLVLNLTPTLTLKGGVEYLDRVRIDWLPAGGLLWQPNPQTKWDIYFPRPKLAKYLGTLGNTDVWWYINGEYGGGSWTIEPLYAVNGQPPPSTANRRVDINDYRVGGGFEWTYQSGFHAYVEVAYVFNREIVYASGPVTEQNLKDTFMLRGGFAY
jgi:hypothetical protein